MHGELTDNPVPKAPLTALAGIMLLTVILAWASTNGFVSTDSTEQDHRPSPSAVEQIQLQFVDRPAGLIQVLDADVEQTITELKAGEDNFVRGVVRGLVRARRGRGIMDEAPFTLTRYADGRLIFSDPMTNEEILLNAFGPTNEQAFDRFLKSDRYAHAH